jgi:acyl-CoA reductase-like NAD-dependent aldehyde dehydrogenase
MADRFDAHAQELGTLVTKENGKKLAEGMFESTTAGATLRHAAAQAITDTFASAGTAHSNIRRSGPRASVSAPR